MSTSEVDLKSVGVSLWCPLMIASSMATASGRLRALWHGGEVVGVRGSSLSHEQEVFLGCCKAYLKHADQGENGATSAFLLPTVAFE